MKNILFEADFSELEKLKTIKANKFMGFVYLIEWGKYVKIGCTDNPYRRFCMFRHNARYFSDKLKRVVISEQHTNYRANEKEMHEFFNEKRKTDTELFDVSLDDAKNALSKLKLLDETEVLLARSEEKAKEFDKHFQAVMGTITKNECRDCIDIYKDYPQNADEAYFIIDELREAKTARDKQLHLIKSFISCYHDLNKNNADVLEKRSMQNAILYLALKVANGSTVFDLNEEESMEFGRKYAVLEVGQ